ncbi:hypothetical protein V8C34DRAFT_273498 [Trichoderma compactum]
MPLLPIPSTPALLLPTRSISPKPLSSLSAIRLALLGLTSPCLLLYFCLALPCLFFLFFFFVLPPPCLCCIALLS